MFLVLIRHFISSDLPFSGNLIYRAFQENDNSLLSNNFTESFKKIINGEEVEERVFPLMKGEIDKLAAEEKDALFRFLKYVLERVEFRGQIKEDIEKLIKGFERGQALSQKEASRLLQRAKLLGFFLKMTCYGLSYRELRFVEELRLAANISSPNEKYFTFAQLNKGKVVGERVKKADTLIPYKFMNRGGYDPMQLKLEETFYLFAVDAAKHQKKFQVFTD